MHGRMLKEFSVNVAVLVCTPESKKGTDDLDRHQDVRWLEVENHRVHDGAGTLVFSKQWKGFNGRLVFQALRVCSHVSLQKAL